MTLIRVGTWKTIKKKQGVRSSFEVPCNISLKREMGCGGTYLAFLDTHGRFTSKSWDFSRYVTWCLFLRAGGHRQREGHPVSFAPCSMYNFDAFIVYSGMWLCRSKRYLGCLVFMPMTCNHIQPLRIWTNLLVTVTCMEAEARHILQD